MRSLTSLIGCAALLASSTLHATPRISEFMASNDSTLADVDGDYSDWIEIHNQGDTAVDLAGYHLTDDPDELTRWTFPGVDIAAGGRLVVFASGKDRSDPAAELHTDFQLDAKGEYLALVAPDGVTVLTDFSPFYPPQFEDQSYGLSPFGTVTQQSFVAGDATGSFHVPSDGSLGTAWTETSFDDGGWATGPGGFGWESSNGPLEPLIGTDISADLRSVNGSGYFRFPFDFDGSNQSVQTLTLTMQADDGFVAYLNGVEIERDRAPAPAVWNSTATGSISDSDNVNAPASYDVSAHAGLVVDGQNVLAVHGMNTSPSGSDFVVRPQLAATVEDTTSAMRVGYYDNPTPGAPDSSGEASGPIFVEFTDKPDRPSPDADLVITAKMQGSNAATASVDLFYRVMYGNEASLEMADDGSGADVLAGDGIFTATIPASAYDAGEMIRWRFEAVDTIGLTTKEPRYQDPQDSHEYVGTAASDPALETRLPVADLFVQNIGAAGTVSGTRGAIFYLGELYDNVFFNRHGQSTGGFPKKSYNIDFNKTQRFRWHPDERRVKDIDLLTNWADKSKVRHVLSWEIMREAGVHAHFAFTVRVNHDGEFFSTADMVEDADDIYLDRAGLNPDGALYKVYDNTLSGGAGGVEKKNRRDENNQDLVEYAAGLNTGTLEQQWDFIYDNTNLPMCVNMAAANCVIRNTDMHRKNWYIYRDTGRSDEWALLPWDLDLAHGRRWNSTDRYFDNNLMWDGVTRVGTAVRLVNLMWSRPDTRAMMQRRIRTLSDRFLNAPDTPMGERYFERRLAEQSALIDPPDIVPSDARQDFVRWGSWIQSGGGQVAYDNPHPDIEDMAEAIARWHDEYLPGRRQFIYNQSADVPAAQAGGATFTYTDLVPADAEASYLVPSDGSLGTDWTDTAFDDSNWAVGQGGFGYGGSNYTPLINTSTEALMRSVHPTIYLRIPFEVADPSAFSALELTVQVDDGFIAYLNGQEIARDARAPAGATWDSEASSANTPEDELIANPPVFDLSAHVGGLVAGTNVLAIHAMNDRTGSSDFLIRAWMRAGTPGAPAPQPTIDFGDIEFKPASNNQEEEFIELLNNNVIAVDVSDWTISGGVEFSIPPGTVIPAGGSLYLSPDVKSFRNRTTSPKGGEQRFVVGPYSGHLSNLGETLELRDHNGALNNNISYVGEPSDQQLYLVISEFMYHPAGDGLAEYIEVLNISETETVDLTGAHFTGAMTFDFTGGAITSLAPGERVLVVRDLAAFEAAYGPGLPVAGEYPSTALSNGGEEIKFEDAENGTIREFEYDDSDPWPTAADGGGSSLVLIAPFTAPDHDDPANWRAARPNPGGEDTGGFNGDPDADDDGDGLNALLEYALGTSDSDPASGPGAYSPGVSGDRPAFSYRQNLSASGVSYDVETSVDLETWQGAAEAGLVESSRVDNGDGTETVTLVHPDPIGGVPVRHFRLVVTGG